MRTFTGAVHDETKPFRVTLAWTDAPGSIYHPRVTKEMIDTTAVYPHIVLDRGKPGLVAVNAAGSEYLVVWEHRAGSDEFAQNDIYARRVSAAGAAIVDSLFPDGDDGRIPTVAITVEIGHSRLGANVAPRRETSQARLLHISLKARTTLSHLLAPLRRVEANSGGTG